LSSFHDGAVKKVVRGQLSGKKKELTSGIVERSSGRGISRRIEFENQQYLPERGVTFGGVRHVSKPEISFRRESLVSVYVRCAFNLYPSRESPAHRFAGASPFERGH